MNLFLSHALVDEPIRLKEFDTSLTFTCDNWEAVLCYMKQMRRWQLKQVNEFWR